MQECRVFLIVMILMITIIMRSFVSEETAIMNMISNTVVDKC